MEKIETARIERNTNPIITQERIKKTQIRRRAVTKNLRKV